MAVRPAYGAGRVVVVGSVNVDHVYQCRRLPAPGETTLATGPTHLPGGKGGNQACAAARWGTPSFLVARVGDDESGRSAREDLRAQGVDTSEVRIADGHVTGLALILLDPRGENSIVVSPGANSTLGAGEVASSLATLGLGHADVVLTSGEIPEPAVRAAALAARDAGAQHVHNAAPPGTPELLAELTGLIVVNEGELTALSGTADREAGLRAVAQGRAGALVTLGAAGAMLDTGRRAVSVPGIPTGVVDTTGAGDAFAGALVAELARGSSLEQAASRAVAAGAVAVTGLGARGAFAARDEVVVDDGDRGH